MKTFGDISRTIKPSTLDHFFHFTTVNNIKREIHVIGERHMGSKEERIIMEKILPYFDSFGFEGVNDEHCLELKIFFWVQDKILNPLTNIFYFLGKRSKKHKSPAQIAYNYAIDNNLPALELEKSWQPSWRTRLFFIFILFFLASPFLHYHFVGYIRLIFLGMLILTPRTVIKMADLGQGREEIMVDTLATHLKNNKNKKILIICGKFHIRPIGNLLQKKL